MKGSYKRGQQHSSSIETNHSLENSAVSGSTKFRYGTLANRDYVIVPYACFFLLLLSLFSKVYTVSLKSASLRNNDFSNSNSSEAEG